LALALVILEDAITDAVAAGASVSDVWAVLAAAGSGWVLTPAGRAAIEAADSELRDGAR